MDWYCTTCQQWYTDDEIDIWMETKRAQGEYDEETPETCPKCWYQLLWWTVTTAEQRADYNPT